MDQLQAFNRLLQIIKGKERHKYYDKVVKLAEDYEAYSTGEHLDDKLQRFSSRISEESWKEYKKITVHIIKSIVSNLTAIYYRVPRANGLKTEYKAESQTQDKEFRKIMDDFCRDGFDKYMERRTKDMIELDPNAWLVIETEGTDGTDYAQPYPYEVGAENAIMYEYEISNLKYLVDLRTIKRKNKEGNLIECEQYTIYTKVGAVKITRMPDPGYGIDMKLVTEVNEIPEQFNLNNYTWDVVVPIPYNLPVVPARCIGYQNDKANDGETYVNMYDACTPLFDKIIKANAEMDVAMAKHVHPQKIQYVRRCPKDGCHECDDGQYRVYTMSEENEIEVSCPSCSGKGYIDVTTSGIEYIYLPMPTAKEEMLDLNNVVKYIAVDLESPKWIFEYIQQMIRLCEKTMFNQDDISSEDVAKTAREIMVNEANKDDMLRTYAVNYALLYDFIVSTSSSITEIPVEIKADVSKDFNMRGLAEWTVILNGLTTAGANDAIIASVQSEIMQSLHGDTDVVRDYMATQNLIPFQSLTKENRIATLSQLDKTDRYRVAAIYGNDIIKLLVIENPLFYDLNFAKQKEMFDAKVLERVAELKDTEPTLPNFTKDLTKE